MMKYIDIPWASMGYFDEDTRVDLIVHTVDDTVTIFDVTSDISLSEDWLSMEVGDKAPRKGVYFPASKVVYVELVPVPGFKPKPKDVEEQWEAVYDYFGKGEDATASKDVIKSVDEYWESDLIGKTTPDMTYEEKYQALFGEDDATTV